MADKAKHAYGSRANLAAAIESGTVDAYDVLFLNGEGEKPAIGWVDKNLNPVIIETSETDLSGIEAELATKANSAEVETKIGEAVTDSVATAKAYTDSKVESAISEHMVKKYEITSVPEGTLVDYREKEIRVMCPVNAVFTKQNVGAGGDANSYYMTFKTYAPNDDAVGYIEHLGDQVDSEILTNFSIDEYGRRYQPSWLALAKYDEATDTWSYYGASSSMNKFIGWDYQIDWYNADGVMIASDNVRINLSNEDCHSEIKPYYWNELSVKINEIENKIEEVSYEVIEF